MKRIRLLSQKILDIVIKIERRNIMNKTFVAIVVGIFWVIGLTSEGLPASEKVAPKTIKVGCSNSLTGYMGSSGAEVKGGYEIAIQHINQKGGIFVKEFNKRIPLEMIMLDDESNPALANI